jgi:hypothetical protein
MADSTPQVIALVRDLIFSSRISATAQGLGTAVRTVRDPAGLANVAGKRLIVDLNLAGAIEAAAAWKSAEAGREIVGFVSHLDRETIDRARELGVDQVLARSRFVEVLASLLSA